MTLVEFGLATAVMALRPGAALLASPVFGNARVPAQVRIAIAIAIGMSTIGNVTPEKAVALAVDAPWFVLGELLIGAAIGFALQAAFGAAMIAGEVIGSTMGIGFATAADGLSGPSPVISNFMGFAATAIFLSAQGHLVLIATVSASFLTLPVGAEGVMTLDIAAFGLALFGGAVAIALPIVCGLVLAQIVLAVIARSAPALNLFAVGLPTVQLLGSALLVLFWPVTGDAIAQQIAVAAGLMPQ